MIPDRELTAPGELELIRSLERGFQCEIHREAAQGFSRLRWVKADLPEFVLGWDCGKATTPRVLFSALLRRRMMRRYGVNIAGSGESPWGTDSDWAAFEAAAAAWLDERLLLPVDVADSRRRARIGAGVKNLVEKQVAGLGPKVTRLSRELSMVTNDSQLFCVRSYFSSGKAGFSYWQDILLPDSSKASIRESYLSMFGVSSQTELRDLSASDVEEAATFVVEQAMKMIGHVRSATEEATFQRSG